MDEREAIEGDVRQCDGSDAHAVLAIINDAAAAYRGVIPEDRWHEPYMTADELASELADGVAFIGLAVRGSLVAIMGVQRRSNVDLIRHAYVRTDWQGRGAGSRLLEHLRAGTERPLLVGTWSAADWAIRFYERHGFARVALCEVAPLLRRYWKVPERQVATSVVLASPPLHDPRALIADAD